MLDDLIANPDRVLTLWERNRDADKAYAAQERDAYLARVKAALTAGYYDQDHVIAAAAHDLAKSGDVSAVLGDARPAPSGERRDLAEAERRAMPAARAEVEEEDAERFNTDFEVQNH